jgi:hypothetical protein
MEADSDAVGLNAEAHARLRTEAALTEALLRAGIEINDDYAAKMDEVVNRVGAAAAKLDETKRSFQGLNDALKFGGNQLVDVLDRAMQKGAKFGDIMSDVLRAVSRQLLQAAITGEGAFAKLLGTSSTTGGVGGLLGILAGAFKPTPVPANAAGTDSWRGGLTWVGEQGPELMNLPRGTQIIPNDVARSLSVGDTHISFAPTVNAPGASQQDVAAALAAAQRSFQASIIPTVRSAFVRREL